MSQIHLAESYKPAFDRSLYTKLYSLTVSVLYILVLMCMYPNYFKSISMILKKRCVPDLDVPSAPG